MLWVWRLRQTRVLFSLGCAAMVLGCLHSEPDRHDLGESDPVETLSDSPNAIPSIAVLPKKFPPIPIPEDNSLTAEKAYLGRHLFYDKRLSRDSTLSCASCHQPNAAFSDPGVRFSLGVDGQLTKRNSPSLTNVAYNRFFFAEGGVPSLELQAIAPILNPMEMDMNTDTLVSRISHDTLYNRLFVLAWGSSEINIAKVVHSLASFERILISGNSPYDRFIQGESSALSPSEKRGSTLFFGEKGDCFHCHNGYNFIDNSFHNNGLSSETPDPGRYSVTDNPGDLGKFKTPTLRNIALTPPYMHSGQFSTLREVVSHYNSGGKAHVNAAALMRPLGMSDSDIDDLVAFLESLTDTAFVKNPALQNPWPKGSPMN